MRRRTTAALLGALLVVATLAGGVAVAELSGSGAALPQHAGTGDRTISVSGTGTAEATPDEVHVRLGVSATADTATAAREQVASNASSVRSALANLGVGDEQVRTAGYDLHQRPAERVRTTSENPELVYHASHTLRVELTDVDGAGAVIDAAVDNGASGVTGVQFTLADATRQRLQRDALRAAMDDAETAAATLASSAGLALGDASSISTVDPGVPGASVETASYAADARTELSAGPLAVSTTVHVTYNATA
jgi:uncharacterized protein YggE